MAIIAEGEKEAQAQARHAKQLQEDKMTIANHHSRCALSFLSKQFYDQDLDPYIIDAMSVVRKGVCVRSLQQCVL